MQGFFTQIEDTEEVRQGDIIRQLNPKNGLTERLDRPRFCGDAAIHVVPHGQRVVPHRARCTHL